MKCSFDDARRTCCLTFSKKGVIYKVVPSLSRIEFRQWQGTDTQGRWIDCPSILFQELYTEFVETFHKDAIDMYEKDPMNSGETFASHSLKVYLKKRKIKI